MLKRLEWWIGAGATIAIVIGCSTTSNLGGGVCPVDVKPKELACSDKSDDDCDGYVDCLDTDCDGQSCGSGGGLTCTAGACLRPGENGLPPLPRIDNVKVTVRGDTAIVDFEPVAGARDYRIYPQPSASDVLVGENGEVVVKNAIYRCAGQHIRVDREFDDIKQYDRSLAGDVFGYKRTEQESVLGYVYLTPGTDRVPVYRLADPNLRGGYVWEYNAPPAKEFNAAEYVTSATERSALIAKGYRDDGIAFYVPSNASRPVYRRQMAQAPYATLFYVDGPEGSSRGTAASAEVATHFSVLADQAAGAVPLYRIFYGWANDHDVLAAGDANRAVALHQGNTPVSSLAWSGLKGDTTLVIEALDAGCPFAGSYIGAMAAPGSSRIGTTLPTIPLDKARLPTGEVFVNGQFEPTSRPKPIARAFVNVSPLPDPTMDWYLSFNPDTPWPAMDELIHDGNGNVVLRNAKMSLEFPSTVDDAYSYGPLLGQFLVGATTSIRMVARGVDAKLSDTDYLHVTMSTTLPSTQRRYPQIWITETPEVTPSEVPHSYDVPLESRLGPFPFENKGPGPYDTIVVQPFSVDHELQIEVCDNRGWGVSQQCDRANLHGWHAGMEGNLGWESSVKWTPVPVLGEVTGVDRPVKIDVYATTSRIYVFAEDKPAGCAIVPNGMLKAGSRRVMFGTSGYHIEIDESVVPDHAAHPYWHRYHQSHVERAFDDLGISNAAPLPAWDHNLIPCGTYWYGGSKP